ncbi:hypothetical protein J6590_049235 [Homalodisca vitripennis]|nr:hypothetical protein J6590_049235 [Homalodisca vitripennis]
MLVISRMQRNRGWSVVRGGGRGVGGIVHTICHYRLQYRQRSQIIGHFLVSGLPSLRLLPCVVGVPPSYR